MKTKPARLDADRSAKPLTRLVKHVPVGDCAGPFSHPNAPMELETVETRERVVVRCCQDPCLRGGCCVNCGAWLDEPSPRNQADNEG